MENVVSSIRAMRDQRVFFFRKESPIQSTTFEYEAPSTEPTTTTLSRTHGKKAKTEKKKGKKATKMKNEKKNKEKETEKGKTG